MIGNVHTAFQLRPGTDGFKQRIESMQIYGNTVYYGDSKGNITVNQLSVEDANFKFQPLANFNVSFSFYPKIRYQRSLLTSLK